MQIVIDISKEDYNQIEPFLNGQKIKGGFNLFKALEIIKNGTPLPKQHGRLIDEEDMLSVIIFSKLFDNAKVGEVKEALLNIPTIIEADKEK